MSRPRPFVSRPLLVVSCGGELEAYLPGATVAVATTEGVMVDELQAERLASNQSLFRVVNEKVATLNPAFRLDGVGGIGFVCECSRLDCAEQIDITLTDYAEVRSNPRWFVVAPSDEHVVAEVEQILARTERYFVVEKIGVGGEVAEQLGAR